MLIGHVCLHVSIGIVMTITTEIIHTYIHTYKQTCIHEYIHTYVRQFSGSRVQALKIHKLAWSEGLAKTNMQTLVLRRA